VILITRQLSLYWEVLKWLAIMMLALATAIAFAARLAGGVSWPQF
jgi:hypothetical protein